MEGVGGNTADVNVPYGDGAQGPGVHPQQQLTTSAQLAVAFGRANLPLGEIILEERAAAVATNPVGSGGHQRTQLYIPILGMNQETRQRFLAVAYTGLDNWPNFCGQYGVLDDENYPLDRSPYELMLCILALYVAYPDIERAIAEGLDGATMPRIMLNTNGTTASTAPSNLNANTLEERQELPCHVWYFQAVDHAVGNVAPVKALVYFLTAFLKSWAALGGTSDIGRAVAGRVRAILNQIFPGHTHTVMDHFSRTTGSLLFRIICNLTWQARAFMLAAFFRDQAQAPAAEAGTDIFSEARMATKVQAVMLLEKAGMTTIMFICDMLTEFRTYNFQPAYPGLEAEVTRFVDDLQGAENLMVDVNDTVGSTGIGVRHLRLVAIPDLRNFLTVRQYPILGGLCFQYLRASRPALDLSNNFRGFARLEATDAGDEEKQIGVIQAFMEAKAENVTAGMTVPEIPQRILAGPGGAARVPIDRQGLVNSLVTRQNLLQRH